MSNHITTTEMPVRPTTSTLYSVVAPLLLVPLLFGGQFLSYAFVFFVLAVVAALVGARGVAGISMEIARIFVILFIIVAIVALVL